METKKRYSIKNILLATLWIGIGAGVAVLLVAAIRKKDAAHCKGVNISIHGVSNNFFVDKTDVLNAITAIAGGNPVGKTTGNFNLKKMETELKTNVWVKNAEMFFDNNEELQVNVTEREPIARVFSNTGTTFYIDDDITMLPLSEKFSARLPVFTNFPSDRKVLSAADSNLLRDIRTISLAIQKDSFRMAMIDQVDITPQGSFEMIPKIGNQLIVFGDANNAEDKFRKLQLFYKKVMVKAGWDYYSVINVQYKNQVVAKRRGAEDISADSLRSLQIMQLIAANAEKQAADSLQAHAVETDNSGSDSSMIQQSIQRDEVTDQQEPLPQQPTAQQPATANATQPAAVSTPPKPKPAAVQAPKPAIVMPPKPRPATQQPKGNPPKPKPTTPKRNDY